jgi:aryl-alcohol dehydrogenase-like predicted oxidoreductase
MHRREFIKSSLLAGGIAAMNPFPHELYASDKKKNANDIIKLGNTGIEVSRLAMGTGTHGVNRASNQTRKLGIKGLGELLHSAYDQGIFFWDSADQYGTHPHLKEALKYVPREKVVILTKTMTKDNWPDLKTGAMNILSQAREDGIIRAHGVSCHTLGALKAAAATDWVQVDLARINPYGSRMDAEVPVVVDVLKDMKKKGKSIIGMKLFGAGELTDKLDECLQYTLGQDFVDCFTIGQEGRGQMEDLLTRIPAASTRG